MRVVATAVITIGWHVVQGRPTVSWYTAGQGLVCLASICHYLLILYSRLVWERGGGK